MSKAEVKKIIKDYQLKLIENLENSIQDKRETVDIDEGEVLDPEDYSRQTETGDLVMRLKRQIKLAKNDLIFLDEIPLDPKDKVVLGALVETKDMYFYVGIPTSIFEYKGKNLVGISTHAPVYQAMLNKSKGEKFKVGTKTYTIVDVL